MDEECAKNIPILSLSDARLYSYVFELQRFFESRDHTNDKDFLNINQHEQSLSNSVKQWLQQAVSYLGLLYVVLDVQRNFELENFPLHFFQSH